MHQERSPHAVFSVCNAQAEGFCHSGSVSPCLLVQGSVNARGEQRDISGGVLGCFGPELSTFTKWPKDRWITDRTLGGGTREAVLRYRGRSNTDLNLRIVELVYLLMYSTSPVHHYMHTVHSKKLHMICDPLFTFAGFNSCLLLNDEGEDSDTVSSFRTYSPRAFSC